MDSVAGGFPERGGTVNYPARELADYVSVLEV